MQESLKSNDQQLFQDVDHTQYAKPDDSNETIMETIAKTMAASEEPVMLEKETSCYNSLADLSGYHLSSKKGQRQALMSQNREKSEHFLAELLCELDKKVKPTIQDDDIGGKWMENIYASSTYNIESLIFHLTPNRSIDYLDDFKEIPGYNEQCLNNHNILSAILDMPCANKEKCWYLEHFFPVVQQPGPIFLPVTIQNILETKRHGLSLSRAILITDLLCSYFKPILNTLKLTTTDGKPITSENLQFQSDITFKLDYDFQPVKWDHNICICCLFMDQSKVQFLTGCGQWIKSGTGLSKEDPLNAVTLLNYKEYIDKKNMTPNVNILSNCININPYKHTRLNLLKALENYIIQPIECFNTKPRFQVIKKI